MRCQQLESQKYDNNIALKGGRKSKRKKRKSKRKKKKIKTKEKENQNERKENQNIKILI